MTANNLFGRFVMGRLQPPASRIGAFRRPAYRSLLFRSLFSALCLLCLSLPSSGALAAQGVSADEIIVGTHADLSGPLSAWGHAVRNGIDMAFAEANEAGGVNGRLVRLIAKDDAYNSTRAASIVDELIDAENVFAILSPLGTPTTHVAAAESLDRNIPYLFPITAAEHPLDLRSPMLFTLSLSADREIADGVDRVLEIRPGANFGVLASDGALGVAVRRGVYSELTQRGHTVTADVSFARDSTDFATPLRWLREKDVGVIVLGAVGDEAIAILQAARAMRWQPTFLCASSCYVPELAALGGEVIEGLYTVGQVPIPYPDDRQLGAWARAYEMRFGSVATKEAFAAYRSARLFLVVMERVGRTPTQANFRHALETLGPWVDPLVANTTILFTADNHQGQLDTFFAQARNGRWVIIPPVSPTRL